MKISLLTHYYPPEVNAPAQRASEHAAIWAKEGHKVSIITAQPSHPFGKLYDGYENKTKIKAHNNITLLRLKTYLSANKGSIRRIVNYTSYMVSAIWNSRKSGPADIVISTSPQFFCGIAGYFVSRWKKAPWILEIRDVWPDSIVAVGAAKPSLATRAVGALAKWAYHKSDMIVSVSPGFSDHFERYGVDPKKISLIPNGIDTDLHAQPCDISEFPELEGFRDKFIAGFVGTLGMAHGLHTIIEAAEILSDDDTIRIVLVGSGAKREQLQAMIEERNLENIVILDQQPRANILKLWSIVSASIVHLKPNDVFKTVIPTKLLEAMAMEKPVILGVEGTALDILNNANAGIPIEPGNAIELANALRTLSQEPETANTYAANGRKYVTKHYCRKKMALKYIDLIHTVLSRKGNREIFIESEKKAASKY